MTGSELAPTTTASPATQPPGMSLPDSAEALVARMEQWRHVGAHAQALVGPLVHSAFVPDAYKPKVAADAEPEERAYAIQVATANATSAVLLGLSIGFDPLTALQQIYIVHGRPGMYAKAKVALLQSKGYEIRTEEYGPEKAVVAGRAPGSEHWERVPITIEDARKAEWTKNGAYGKTPADMLWARAAGRVCDRIGGPVLMGMATAEDLSDASPLQVSAQTGTPVRQASAADILGDTGTVSSGPSNPGGPDAATDPAPATADKAPDNVRDLGDAELTPVQMITEEQRDHLSILLGQTGRRVSAAKKFIKDTIGKDVAGPHDLNHDEAELVIAALQAEVDAREAGGDPQ